MVHNLETFGTNIKTMDVLLYAGVAIVVYVLFKEQIHSVLNKIKEKLNKTKAPNLPSIDMGDYDNLEPDTKDDIFFQLIMSWKQTRDLAETYGADKAVEIADQMFPHLVPGEENHDEE